MHRLQCCMQYMFWDMEAALKLIKEQYSWFLPTFETYSSVVFKGEAVPSIEGPLKVVHTVA